MQKAIRNTTLSLSRMDSQKVRLVISLATLVMFILAAGAPAAAGGH